MLYNGVDFVFLRIFYLVSNLDFVLVVFMIKVKNEVCGYLVII